MAHRSPEDSDTGRILVLEAQMKTLIGNGQPGRMDKVEKKAAFHDKMLWVAMGGLYVLHVASANGWLKLTH